MASSQDEQKPKLAAGQDVPMTTTADIPEEELQLEQALRQLKLLHIKSRDLRTTIPRMLDTMATRGAPEQVFATFTAAVTAAQTEIKDFGILYNSEESQKALDQAQKSREAEPNGIKPWLHNDEPDWYFMDE